MPYSYAFSLWGLVHATLHRLQLYAEADPRHLGRWFWCLPCCEPGGTPPLLGTTFFDCILQREGHCDDGILPSRYVMTSLLSYIKLIRLLGKRHTHTHTLLLVFLYSNANTISTHTCAPQTYALPACENARACWYVDRLWRLILWQILPWCRNQQVWNSKWRYHSTPELCRDWHCNKVEQICRQAFKSLVLVLLFFLFFSLFLSFFFMFPFSFFYPYSLFRSQALLTLTSNPNKNIGSKGQILIRWSVQSGFVSIPKSTRAERIKQNADVFSWTIPDEDMAALAALNCDFRCV